MSFKATYLMLVVTYTFLMYLIIEISGRVWINKFRNISLIVSEREYEAALS